MSEKVSFITMASDVSEFYKNKHIFITGGAGFLGIALIEKILRASPNVGAIYLLIRPKQGKSVEQRLEELIKNEVFEVLLKEQPESIFKKLVAIPGDIAEEDLGISPCDREELINKVNVIIHSAATFGFNETLRSIVGTNLLGTRRVCELAKEMLNLHSFIHVSSAYANSYLVECDEILYPANADSVIEMVTVSSDNELKAKQANLLGEHLNAYTFTKHLAEHEVAKCIEKFPCGVVRPSMITASWKEPTRGWMISGKNPQGFFMEAANGVIRRLPMNSSLIYDYIPVDVVVNQVLVTGYAINHKNSNELSIYHCTSSSCQPFKWEGIINQINGYLHKYPVNSAVWYPNLKFTSSLLLFKISAIFFHFLPAYMFDGVTRVAGGRPTLVEFHKNLWNVLTFLEKFIFTEWKFHNNNTRALIEEQTLVDKKLYNIDLKNLEWQAHFIYLFPSVKQFLHTNDQTFLKAARRKDKILLAFYVLLQLSFYGAIWWLTAKTIGCTMAKCALIVPIYYVLFSFL